MKKAKYVVYSFSPGAGWCWETELSTEDAAVRYAKRVQKAKKMRVRVDKVVTLCDMEV